VLYPFSIIKEVGKYTYQLELLPTMNINPIFHVSLVELVYNNPQHGQIIPATEPVIVKGRPEYKV
jgi:hypothetical protein